MTSHEEVKRKKKKGGAHGVWPHTVFAEEETRKKAKLKPDAERFSFSHMIFEKRISHV